MNASPPPIRVAVNDRQLPVAAVVDRGHVLVPLRAIAEALHLDLHSITLPLKRPARLIAGRWYAPVRQMATLVHAQIQYDAQAKLVAVYTTHQDVAMSTPVPTAEPIRIKGREPADNARIGSAYPTIAADLDLPNGSTIRSLHLTLDGVDRTLDTIYQGTYLTYIPRLGLGDGIHTVDVNGTTSSGAPFDTSWSFETTSPPQQWATSGAYGESWNGFPYMNLSVPGTQFIGGAPVPVQLIAPPGGIAFAFVCTSSWQYQLFSAPTSQYYSGSVPTSRVNYPISCPITAMYVSPNGATTYSPYPQFIELLPMATPQPAPSPTRVPAPNPVATRSPLPSPTPTPAPLPTFGHSPLPLPTMRSPRPLRTILPRTPHPQLTPRPTPTRTPRAR